MNVERTNRFHAGHVALLLAAILVSVSAYAQSSSVNLDDSTPSAAVAAPHASEPARAVVRGDHLAAVESSASGVRTVAASSVRGSYSNREGHARAHAAASKADPLDPRQPIFVKDTAPPAVDLPGVLQLNGPASGLLDPVRAKRVSCTNEGTTTVYLSATEPNRVQLPFVNPRVIRTDDLEVQKWPNRSNVYITFAPGIAHPATVWLEPHSSSSLSCGLQVIPMKIPAQSIAIVDDASASTAKEAGAEEANDFLSRVQVQLQDALEGQSPAGWSTVNLPVPPIAIDGVLIEGVRRLSGLEEDIYVYTVLNPGPKDVILEETEFDGPKVEAVSILPTPLLHPRGTTRVAVLAKKSATADDVAATAQSAEGR